MRILLSMKSVFLPWFFWPLSNKSWILLCRCQPSLRQVAPDHICLFCAKTSVYCRFMWTLYSKDPEHWIPIQTVASFKRMRQFSSRGLEWVTNALRLSDFLEVDETGTKVRRTTEPQPPKNQFERSVYAVRAGALLNSLAQVFVIIIIRKGSARRNLLYRAGWRNSLINME